MPWDGIKSTLLPASGLPRGSTAEFQNTEGYKETIPYIDIDRIKTLMTERMLTTSRITGADIEYIIRSEKSLRQYHLTSHTDLGFYMLRIRSIWHQITGRHQDEC